MYNEHLLTTSHPNETSSSEQNVNNPERIASTVAGGALVVFGLKQGGLLGTGLTILGGGLLHRGTTGHCYMYEAAGINTNDTSRSTVFGKAPGILSGTIHVKKAVTVNRSPAELYQYWRNFENFPNFMQHLESVTKIDEKRSHWKAKAPLGTSVEWDAEMTSDVENQRIGWQSLEGADIPNTGTVEFRPTADRGTEIIVTMIYEAPGGKIGEWAAWALGEEPSSQVAKDLKRFKSLMEAGTILTTEGQPSGRSEGARPMARAARA
jgi:uncharacterized membrane protein